MELQYGAPISGPAVWKLGKRGNGRHGAELKYKVPMPVLLSLQRPRSLVGLPGYQNLFAIHDVLNTVYALTITILQRRG